MKTTDTISEKKKKIWISITGYRTLLILKVLLEKGRTVNELIEILKSNKITQKSVSKDTLRITLNTLKTAGCDIARPSKSNGYTYSITNHPFFLKLSSEDINSLIFVRDKFSNELSWQKVIVLNNLYEKLISLTNDEASVNLIEDSKPFNNINLNLLREIADLKLKGKKVHVTYSSPKYGEENFAIVPQRISYENGKLYLWCYSFKYNKMSILNIERLKKIDAIDILPDNIVSDYYEVEYELFGNSKLSFVPDCNEEIIDKNETSIIVRARVSNEFWFIQRLFLFGGDFKIITPESFREKLINKIKLIKKGYEE